MKMNTALSHPKTKIHGIIWYVKAVRPVLKPGERIKNGTQAFVTLGQVPLFPHFWKTFYGDDISPVQGHTVVRVPPGGATYQVLILDASDESMRVIHSREFSSRPAEKL